MKIFFVLYAVLSNHPGQSTAYPHLYDPPGCEKADALCTNRARQHCLDDIVRLKIFMEKLTTDRLKDATCVKEER